MREAEAYTHSAIINTGSLSGCVAGDIVVFYRTDVFTSIFGVDSLICNFTT